MHAALLGLEHIHGYALGWVSSSFRRIRGSGIVFCDLFLDNLRIASYCILPSYCTLTV